MDLVVVVGMIGIMLLVVVEYFDFVFYLDQWYFVVFEDCGVQYNDLGDGSVNISWVVGFQGRFQFCQVC